MKNYLSKSFHFSFLILLYFFYTLATYKFLFIGSLTYLGLIYLYRAEKIKFLEDPTYKKDIVYSPINGVIKSINRHAKSYLIDEELIELKIVSLPWESMGIYSPTTGEVEENKIFFDGQSHFRLGGLIGEDLSHNSHKGMFIGLKRKSGEKLYLHFLKCFFGDYPNLILDTGDRVKEQVNIGYLPFGGTLLLYLPKKYEILVEKGQKVQVADTPLAGVPS